METHRIVLEHLINNPEIDCIDESSEIDVSIIKELIDSGLVNAIYACSDDGDCFLEPRINLQGREWLASLKKQVGNTQIEDIIELKPNFMGLGINLNALFRWFKR